MVKQEESNNEVIQRLKRIEGQIRGIQRMILEERSCDEIVVQLMAVRAAIDNLTASIVVRHATDCIEKLPSTEAKEAIARTVRLLAKRPSQGL